MISGEANPRAIMPEPERGNLRAGVLFMGPTKRAAAFKVVAWRNFGVRRDVVFGIGCKCCNFAVFSLPLIAVVTICRSEADTKQGESARDYAK